MEFFRGIVCLLLFTIFGNVLGRYVAGQSPGAELTIMPNKGKILGVNATLTCKVYGKGLLDVVRLTLVDTDLGKEYVIVNMLSLKEEYKESGRYSTNYVEDSGIATLTLYINGVLEADLGLYQCLLLGDKEYQDTKWLMRERPPTPDHTAGIGPVFSSYLLHLLVSALLCVCLL